MVEGESPEGDTIQTCLRELSGLLWRERIALDRLADELISEEPERDCDGLYRTISALELHRAIAAREAAQELGVIEGDPTLQQLVSAAPLGWADLLMSHRRALVDLTNEVTHLARRPTIDLTDDATVRRGGVQRSLREFLA